MVGILTGFTQVLVTAFNANEVWQPYNVFLIKINLLDILFIHGMAYPKWWATEWIQALFGICAILLVIILTKLRTSILSANKRKLEIEIERRIHQVNIQKAEIEKKNRKLQTQNEKLQKSYEQIIEQNNKLKANNEEILDQRRQIREKSRLLECAHQEIKAANNQLKKMNGDLEKIVDLRTKELKNAIRKLVRTDEELNTFLYRSSHDLRGPITTMIGLTKLAKRENMDPALDNYLDKMDVACLNMLKTLKKLTDTNIVFQRKRLSKDIDMHSLVHEIELELEKIDPENVVEKHFTISLESEITSDALLLKTIIYNLVENAIIFRSNRNPQVFITIRSCPENMMINVHDNGMGINKQIQENIFAMFYRGSTRSQGNGLGLYLVQKSVELLHGHIELESEESEYTGFTITLPNENFVNGHHADELITMELGKV